MDSVMIASFLALVAGLGLIGGIAAVLIMPPAPPVITEPPTVEIHLIATEVGGRFLFGHEDGEPSEPGPTVKVKVGDVVKITLEVKGKIPHSFAVARDKTSTSQVLFYSQLGTPSRPVEPGKSASIVFKPNAPGEYYYICTVPNHAELGMWGKFIVEK